MSQYSRLRRQSYNHPHLRQFSPYRRSRVGAGAEAEPEAVTYTVENEDKSSLSPESKEPAVVPSLSGWTIWSVVLISSSLVVVLVGIYFALAYWVFSDLWPFNTSSSLSSHKSSSTGSNLGIGPPSEGSSSSSSSSQFDFSSSPSISSSAGLSSSTVQTISSSLSYSSSPPLPPSSSVQVSSSLGHSSSPLPVSSSPSSSGSSISNNTVHAFLIYGQSNAQGFGANQSPIPTVNNTFQYSITDGFSDYFEFNPPNNWNNHSGQIVPFTMEPLEDSQSPLYSSSICGGDSGGSLIGFTASFSKQYQINNPGVSVLLLNCAIGGAGYGSGDPAGNIGLMTSAYWGVGSPLSNRCISAAQNITRLWSNVTFKGAIVIHGETDASNSMPGSTYQGYSIPQWNTFIANIPTITNSTPIIFVSMVPGWLRTSVGTAQQIQATINNFPSVIPHSCSIQGADLAPGDCGLIHYSGPAQVLNGVNIANAFKSCPVIISSSAPPPPSISSSPPIPPLSSSSPLPFLSSSSSGGLCTTPSSLTLSCISPNTPLMWLSASQISGVSSGNPVATWPDLSGNSNAALGQTGTIPEPLYYPSVVNNQYPAVYFNGNMGLIGPTIFPTNHNFTLTALVNASLYDTSLGYGGVNILSSVLSTNGNTHAFGVFSNTASGTNRYSEIYQVSGDFIWSSSNPKVAPINQFIIISISYNINTLVASFYNGGRFIGNGTYPGGTPPVADNSVCIGCFDLNFTPTFNWIGHMAEVLLFNQALNQTQITSVESPIMNAYGLTYPQTWSS